MDYTDINIALGVVPLKLSLLQKENLSRFTPFESYEAPLAEAAMPEKAFLEVKPRYTDKFDDAYIEFMHLPFDVSSALLPFDRCVFHGMAFEWQGRAWIITAPPGTGKSTQYVLWKMLCGDNLRIINGDKPVLSFTDSGITVHPSPWKGKERIGQDITAPLGGLIYLSQSSENHIERMQLKDAAIPVLKQFFFLRNDEASLKKAQELTLRLLNSVPVWHLANKGDPASAKLTHDTLLEYLSQSTS